MYAGNNVDGAVSIDVFNNVDFDCVNFSASVAALAFNTKKFAGVVVNMLLSNNKTVLLETNTTLANALVVVFTTRSPGTMPAVVNVAALSTN